MSPFFDWADEKNIEETTLLGIREDLMAAHARAHIARTEYKILLELMEKAGERERKAEAEERRLAKLLEAIR